ncbi:hypothetical protein U14_04618 [Candidatus Moduliflexus flocculans]|uniref:Uncharacterized protein n=1 Tax=Candidatus Moduliflexus flocculans TaxID=1499966 RepID=A0A0S6W4P0_9BACT|nr:hypothetical protein U14_04618 [Candidatus Moduliflexus flocculans]
MIRDAMMQRIGRYLPAEDSQLAAFIKDLIVLLKIVRALAVLVGVSIIWDAWQRVNGVTRLFPPPVVKGILKTFEFFWPFFLELFQASISYLLQPILACLLIALLTKSAFWRKFWYVVCLSWYLLDFLNAAQRMRWDEYHLLILLMLQAYLFLLWLFPQEIWNLIGLSLSCVLGVVILIMPDLPTAFDDFGMFGAILAFFLGYVNAVASLVQRVAHWLRR